MLAQVLAWLRLLKDPMRLAPWYNATGVTLYVLGHDVQRLCHPRPGGRMKHHRSLSWLDIFRIGLVQAAIGAVVVLTTSTLNRVMVVELALPAALPGALVAAHYFIQMSRPRFGHGSDVGGARTPWIVGGMAVLGAGGILAAIGHRTDGHFEHRWALAWPAWPFC